jgi:hypothetical protein
MLEVAAMCDELSAESDALELENMRLRCVILYDKLLSPQVCFFSRMLFLIFGTIFTLLALGSFQFEVLAPLWSSLRRMADGHQALFVALHRSMLKLPTGLCFFSYYRLTPYMSLTRRERSFCHRIGLRLIGPIDHRNPPFC